MVFGTLKAGWRSFEFAQRIFDTEELKDYEETLTKEKQQNFRSLIVEYASYLAKQVVKEKIDPKDISDEGLLHGLTVYLETIAEKKRKPLGRELLEVVLEEY
ncbi:MAG: hypothetical protein DRP11_05035 [Candidatus Aenigmatarchaeota archaeon]|nr:MAG: hypothetical protein DRP11_05035 [Candidatus Aenigmarchaeota archaeon]